MSYVSISHLEKISKLDNQKYDQEFMSTCDKIQHLIDLLPFDGMDHVLDDDVRFAEQRAVAQLRKSACADPRCKIAQAGVLHFHCPNCGAPYKMQFNNWNDVINIPKYCQWCRAQMTYPRDAVEAVEDAIKAINDYNADLKAQKAALKELKAKKAALKELKAKKAALKEQNNDAFNDGMTNGYWKDGTLYSPEYGTAYYDPLQPDSDSYQY